MVNTPRPFVFIYSRIEFLNRSNDHKMKTEPAELNKTTRCVFNGEPCIQRTRRNQKNATLEATLGIEPR